MCPPGVVYCSQSIIGVNSLADIEKATVWGIHPKDDSIFLNQDIIAIGWDAMGDLLQITSTPDAYKESCISA